MGDLLFVVGAAETEGAVEDVAGGVVFPAVEEGGGGGGGGGVGEGLEGGGVGKGASGEESGVGGGHGVSGAGQEKGMVGGGDVVGRARVEMGGLGDWVAGVGEGHFRPHGMRDGVAD